MRKLHFAFIFLLTITTSFSQLRINFPLSRSVFQRDNKNSSSFSITGNYDSQLDKVEARLVPIRTGQGTAVDWTLISDKPDGGSFLGTLTAQGGWYRLEVRGVKDSKVIMQASVDKVGVGEVFIIAGQSNAEGRKKSGQKAATDDRVNCFDYEKLDFLDEIPPFQNFSQLYDEVSIAPRGQGAWCWGELGDYLVKRLNVPVMFFNASYEGSTIENWYSSSIGVPTKHQFYKFTFPKDTPYSNLRISLQYYISQLGIRAILWEQGENDSETSEEVYLSQLKNIIDKSRKDSGKKIAWVVARTSLLNNKTYPQIISAQNKVIATTELTFPGPITDTVQVPRFDGSHFINQPNDFGLSKLAFAWQNSLTNDFFLKSEPFLPAPMVSLKGGCNASSADKVTVTLPSSYDSQLWSNGSTQPTISASTGVYSAVVRDKVGNYFFTSSIDVKTVFPTNRPTIFAKSNTSFCPDGSVELIAETEFANVKWSTGETTRQIVVKTPGTYTAQGFNNTGCISQVSNSIITRYISVPAKPTISLSGTPQICEGTPITLTSSPLLKYLWSTKDSTRAITLSKAGNYDISVIVKDASGCSSPPSDVVKISIQPKPETPEITKIGVFTLAAQMKNPNADLYEWRKDNILLNLKTASIKTIKAGAYNVTAVKNYTAGNQQFTCKSATSGIISYLPDLNIKNLVIYPNPTVDGLIYVETIEDVSDLNFGVYTPDGLEMYKTKLPTLSERKLIDLSSLREGKYVIRVFNDALTYDETRYLFYEKK